MRAHRRRHGQPMVLGIRARWWWHRHPVAGWGLSIGLIASLLSVPDLVGPVGHSGARTRSVVVARTDLPIGHRVVAGDVATRVLDQVDGTPVETPLGRVVTALVLEGEPLVAERLAPSGADGTAALVPSGEVALAVPVSLAAPPVAPGDQVEVFITDGYATRRAAGRALVVAVAEDAITVSLQPDEAAAVAEGLTAGAVTLGLLGPAP